MIISHTLGTGATNNNLSAAYGGGVCIADNTTVSIWGDGKQSFQSDLNRLFRAMTFHDQFRCYSCAESSREHSYPRPVFHDAIIPYRHLGLCNTILLWRSEGIGKGVGERGKSTVRDAHPARREISIPCTSLGPPEAMNTLFFSR